MADTVNMSLDEIIKRNRVSRSRGRGDATVRGRGGGNRGRGRGRGRGAGGRGRSQSGTDRSVGRQGRSRSRSRARSQSRGRSQSRARSRSRQYYRPSQSRSRSRSQIRHLTPKQRAGLENQQIGMPLLVRSNRIRGGQQRRPWNRNANLNQTGNIHTRLGVQTRRGAANNIHRPLAVAKRGISKRGRGFSTGNRYSNIGLRSDQILKQQHESFNNYNNIIKSQTFTRSRNNSFNSASQLTVSVANDFTKRRRNSVGNAGYLNKQTLAQLNKQLGGFRNSRGPGSVKSMGSNRSYHSNASSQSNRSRGRGRGRGGNRGIGRNFVNKQVLNSKLQKEIAAIQGKNYGSNLVNESPGGVNFTPTPAATGQSLHQRFASA